jgi:hypothetical protein
MKKFWKITTIATLSCLCLVGATACTSAQSEEPLTEPRSTQSLPDENAPLPPHIIVICEPPHGLFRFEHRPQGELPSEQQDDGKPQEEHPLLPHSEDGQHRPPHCPFHEEEDDTLPDEN